MRHDFTAIHEALEQLIHTMDSARLALTKQANAEREELLSLYARMRDTQNDLIELGDLAADASDALGTIEVGSYSCADLIGDVLDLGLVPECSYEDFVGYCAVCGNTISSADGYETAENGEMLCVDCAPADEDEDEPSDGE